MRVQIIAIPPIDAARAITIVRVVFVVEVAPVAGGAVLLELASEEVMVLISVDGLGELVGVNEGTLFCGGGVEEGVGVEEEGVEEEEGMLEEDTLELRLELRELESVSGITEEGESGSEVGFGRGLLETTGETELTGPPALLGSPPSSFVPESMMSPKFCLPWSWGDRLRSILWPST